MHFDEWLLVSSLLLLLSILAWKVSSRLGIPALLLFLGIGMLAGSDGPGGIYFDNALLAQEVGIVALAFILFAGGLETQWKVVRPALGAALSLSTIGVLLTAVIVAVFALVVLHFSFVEGLLLGAIISATDAAAVFSVLGARNLQLKGKLLPLLELESGTNDPMAVFLTVGLTALLANPKESVVSLLLLFVQQMGVGAVLGLSIGWAAIWLISRLHLDVEGLYRVFTIALVLFAYGLTALLGGSGFLAVYVVGVLLGNSAVQQVDRLSRFHDSLAWLMQIAMFLILGLLVFPSRLPAVVGSGLLITGVAVFLARPLSVLIALQP
ncbi:MAG: potassium/proton antiporter, partial [Chloroflexi bacterium]